MKNLFLFFVLILCSKHFYGQSCEIADLSQPDKAALQSFWNDFRESVNKHDTLKLLSLCAFPFYCNYCTATKIKSPDILLKTQFFFAKEFIEEINKHDEPGGYFIVHGSIVNKGQKVCAYIFPFTVKKDRVLYFDVNKVGDAYKINSTWTIE